MPSTRAMLLHLFQDKLASHWRTDWSWYCYLNA